MNTIHECAATHESAAIHDALVLQGGAGHALFTLGFLQQADPALTSLLQIGAVSSGAAVACLHLLGRHTQGLDYFLAAAQRVNPSDLRFELRRLLRGEPPTLHYTLYRSALHDLLTESAWRELREHPVRLRILVACGPGSSRFVTGALAALSMARGRTLPGLTAQVFEAQQCRSREELLAVLLASSAVPLVSPIPVLAGRACADGGSVAPIPLCAAASARNPLVVLTGPQPLRPIPDWMRRVAPAEPLPISPWSFGDAQGLRRIFELGSQVGARFAAEARTVHPDCHEPSADGTKAA